MIAGLEVDITRDAVDWVLLGVSVATALATLGAVAVALFGPAWRERQTRPVVRLHTATALRWERDADPADTEGQDYPPMSLTNARGKAPAQGVEVFVTVGLEAGSGAYLTLAHRENLNFRSPQEGRLGAPVSHVPAGFSREFFFILFGHPQYVFECLHPDSGVELEDSHEQRVGILSLFPARRENARWLTPGAYAVTFWVTGSNFDVVRYDGRFEVTAEERQRGAGRVLTAGFRWLLVPELQRVRGARGRPTHADEDPWTLTGPVWTGPHGDQ